MVQIHACGKDSGGRLALIIAKILCARTGHAVHSSYLRAVETAGLPSLLYCSQAAGGGVGTAVPCAVTISSAIQGVLHDEL